MSKEPFWMALDRYGVKAAVSGRRTTISYMALEAAVTKAAHKIIFTANVQRPLVILKLTQSPTSIINYLGCLRSRAVALLLPASCPDDLLNDYVKKFNPNLIISEGVFEFRHDQAFMISDELALLLSTSGSTGVAKCVALSYRNIQENTASILAYLPVEPHHNILANLPFSYAYGLSVLNTHLASGAHIVTTSLTVFNKKYWQLVRDLPVHALSGVPVWYQMLLKLGFSRMRLPDLKYFTLAGGRLPCKDVASLAEIASVNRQQFFVMYGQTEATARMAFLSPDVIHTKPGSIGQPIQNGSFRLSFSRSLQGCFDQIKGASGPVGELEYCGPNVMLGYVNCTSDLAVFNSIEWLSTGDIAQCDPAGDYYIVGRRNRILKVAGERVNLDALEVRLASFDINCFCVGSEDIVYICYLQRACHLLPGSEQSILDRLVLSKNYFRFVGFSFWPLRPNGKLDYTQLLSQAKVRDCLQGKKRRAILG